MKKLLFILMALLLLVPTGVGQARQDNVTLVYMTSQGWVKDPELELGKMFEEETGIHVDYQIIPADQYFNILQTKLNTGEGPDIFGGQSGVSDLQIIYDVEKNAVDLSGEEWVSREDPKSLAETTLNGKIYGLTIWDTRGGIFDVVYNKQIFADLGLSIPTTYDEFKAVCLAIQEAGITPIFEPVADGWHHVLWFPELGARYEEVTPGLAAALNANETVFADNATMLLVLEQLKEMYALGFFGEFTLSDQGSDTAEMLATGQYAMSLSVLSLPASIERDFSVPADQFGFFVMPLADNQNLNANPGGPSKFIYSGSSHIEEAKAYFNFLTRPENLQYLLDNEDDFSYLNFAGVEDKFTPEQSDFFARYPNSGPGYQVSVSYVNPQWMEIGQDITGMFIGDLDPVGVLENIDQRRSEMATAASDPAWTE
jgi:raffinose/stachyose/melibiose transport system substrate-binding protein